MVRHPLPVQAQRPIGVEHLVDVTCVHDGEDVPTIDLKMCCRDVFTARLTKLVRFVQILFLATDALFRHVTLPLQQVQIVRILAVVVVRLQQSSLTSFDELYVMPRQF